MLHFDGEIEKPGIQSYYSLLSGAYECMGLMPFNTHFKPHVSTCWKKSQEDQNQDLSCVLKCHGKPSEADAHRHAYRHATCVDGLHWN